jgi:hypothetical protein
MANDSGKKLGLSRETLRALTVRSTVRTGAALFLTFLCFSQNQGCKGDQRSAP